MTRTTLFGALAALGVAGLALGWHLADPLGDLPAPQPISLPHPSAAPGAAIEAVALAGVIEGLNQRPLFRPGRRAPPPAASPAASAPAAQANLPRLAGVVIGPGGGRAIFAVADGKSAVATEGTSLGRFTVKSIAPGRVTVAGPEGEIELRPALLKGTP
jgi:hypothetical protein